MAAHAISGIDSPIVLEANKIGGLGDISATFKIASLLASSGIAKDRIVISLEDLRDAKSFNAEGFTIISHAEKPAISNVALQIFFPAIKGYVYPDVPILRLEEYDADPEIQARRLEEGVAAYGKRFHYAAFGLSGIGVFIDPEIKRFAKEHSEPSIEHLLPMLALSPSLQDVLFNNTFVGAGASGGEGAAAEDKLHNFFRTSRLYTGHVSSFKTALSFFRAIGLLNLGDEKNIHICLPLPLSKFPKLSTFLLSQMKELKLGEVVINSYDPSDGKYKEVERIIGPAEGKRLTITLGPFTQSDMRQLWMASERESVATGDQSISEALAAEKSFVYESLVHKRFLASQLQTIFDACLGTEGCPIAMVPSYDPEALLKCYSFQRTDHHKTMHAVSDMIVKEKDCRKCLSSFVRDLCGK